MKHESGFQKAFIKDFRELGFFVGAGSLSPGYPDVTAIKNNRVILIELKDAAGIGPGVQVLSLFQKAQAPFYVRYLKNGTETVHIVFKIGDIFHLYTMRKVTDVKLLIASTLSSIIEACTTFKSIKELVLFISL